MKLLHSILAFLLLIAPFVTPAESSAQGQDPRSDNAKAFHLNPYTGKVDGMNLVWEERPYTTYQLVQARLIDEQEAAGNTVAKYMVVDCYGTPMSEKVWLAWAWPQLADGHLLPGNQNNEHMIGSKFPSTTIGPLAIYVGNGAAEPISDIIGGLGLPDGRHVSFYLVFRKRCGLFPTATPAPAATATPIVPPTAVPPTAVVPTPSPTPAPGHDPNTQLLIDIKELLRQLLAWEVYRGK